MNKLALASGVMVILTVILCLLLTEVIPLPRSKRTQAQPLRTVKPWANIETLQAPCLVNQDHSLLVEFPIRTYVAGEAQALAMTVPADTELVGWYDRFTLVWQKEQQFQRATWDGQRKQWDVTPLSTRLSAPRFMGNGDMVETDEKTGTLHIQSYDTLKTLKITDQPSNEFGTSVVAGNFCYVVGDPGYDAHGGCVWVSRLTMMGWIDPVMIPAPSGESRFGSHIHACVGTDSVEWLIIQGSSQSRQSYLYSRSDHYENFEWVGTLDFADRIPAQVACPNVGAAVIMVRSIAQGDTLLVSVPGETENRVIAVNLPRKGGKMTIGASDGKIVLGPLPDIIGTSWVTPQGVWDMFSLDGSLEQVWVLQHDRYVRLNAFSNQS